MLLLFVIKFNNLVFSKNQNIIKLSWSWCQTYKKMIFVRKPIFRVEECPQIHIVPKDIKVNKIALFPLYQIFSNKDGLIVDNIADIF